MIFIGRQLLLRRRGQHYYYVALQSSNIRSGDQRWSLLCHATKRSVGVLSGGGDAPYASCKNTVASTPIIISILSNDRSSSSIYYMAWGAAISASIMFGFTTHYYSYPSNIHLTTSLSNSHQFCIQQKRGYHQQRNIASCESSSSTKSSKDKEGSSDGGSKSNSFFDMAQQWANDYVSAEKSEEDEKEKVSVAREREIQEENDATSSSMSPEALLEAMGILGGCGDVVVANQNADSSSNEKYDNKKEEGEDEEPINNNLKGMMQKVLFRFDDFKSSLPKSSPSISVKDANNSNQSIKTEDTKDDTTEDSSGGIFSEFLSFANNASLFTQRSSSQQQSSPSIEELIEQAQSIANNVSSSLSSPSDNNNNNNNNNSNTSAISSTSSSFLSQVLYFQQNATAIQNAFTNSFGTYLSHLDMKDIFQSIPVAALHYYLEYQDSIKTPSWKRRKHRFQRDVEVMTVEELNEALLLSELSYADNVDEIRTGLERMYNKTSSGGRKKKKEKSGRRNNNNKPQWELLFCDTESRPNQPSHFLAIQKNASPYDDTLHVLLVVRGTKSMSDLITDAMMEASDYEYTLPSPDDNNTKDTTNNVVIRGKAHVGMQSSGRYLVERHQRLLSTLMKLSKKRKLDITLIGHSLGAGAASIAAMEWNSKPLFDNKNMNGGIECSARVIGFGCPALLSKDLSIATKEYVTTVIADADFIPRMSGATLVNLLLDVTSFDYRMQAERDVEQALRELQSRFAGQPSVGQQQQQESKAKSKLAFGLDEDDIQTIMGYVQAGLEKVANPISSSPARSREGTSDGSKFDKVNEDITEQHEKMTPVLFPPGECIHFYRDGSGISGTYVPCDFFNEIDVARTMVDDHLISSGYRKIFLNLMRDFKKDDHFSFDSK